MSTTEPGLEPMRLPDAEFDRTVERLCSTHGPYESKVYTIPGHGNQNGGFVHTVCPRCTKDRDAAAQEHERKRNQDAAASRLAAAMIPARFAGKTLRSFEANTDAQREAVRVCDRYLVKWETVRKKGACLVMCGNYGTGKTMLACAIMAEAICGYGVLGITGLYTSALNAVRRIKDTWRPNASETEKQAIAAFVRPDLLVLDEVGVQFGTEAEKLLLFDILNGRYEDVKPTIVISNLDVTGMSAYLGERVMDRLKEGGGYVLGFDWQSYREGGQ